ncbi:MAG: class I SAM-dependent methyltransferase [Candidatus Hodarchaeota archaeon]
MRFITRATFLYEFLRQCNLTTLEREVLDCGAGGRYPPLSIFYESGYKTHGIDISEEAIVLANSFCKKHEIELNIIKGDIRKIPYDDETIPFVYSFNTIMHLNKKDTAIAMSEIERVLRTNGLCYINFQSKSCQIPDLGEEISPGEYLTVLPDGEEVIHSLFDDDEPEYYFKNFDIIHKEKRLDFRATDDKTVIVADLHYIAKKNR